jgi:hypothetical protein
VRSKVKRGRAVYNLGEADRGNARGEGVSPMAKGTSMRKEKKKPKKKKK